MSNFIKWLIILAVLAAGVVLAASILSNDQTPGTNGESQTNTAQTDNQSIEETPAETEPEDQPAVESTSVSIVSSSNDGFSPRVITVKAGSTVTWTNQDSLPHTVEFDNEESDQLNSGDTYSKTFDAAGTYEYICGIHPNMTGTVVVTD